MSDAGTAEHAHNPEHAHGAHNHPDAVQEQAPEAPAADPAIIGLPTFIVGAVALAMVYFGVIDPVKGVGASVAIIMATTALGQWVAAIWAARIGQTMVSGIFAIFGGFWFSYGILVFGLLNDWFGLGTDADLIKQTQTIFLISWIVGIVMLTLATLRLPAAFTVLFVFVDIALILNLINVITGTAVFLKAAAVAIIIFAAVGVYLFFGACSVATGGKEMSPGKPTIKS